MPGRSIVSPEDQGATFVELFFDLVFVFAVTQITHYAAHHLDGAGILRSTVLFWLIWWGWAQFTWALNSANTDHQGVRVVTLLATGVAFVMAVSVKGAFSTDLIILALTLGGLAWSAQTSVQQVLGMAAAGLAVIVAVEQVTTRRRLLAAREGA
jgi:low temperature requirement protein LtrA